ncbi:unnamed protein product [Caenorhabditis sp. 36 PRJEB53466]|nr:unnamed protein product [Caenorhabditis sp. 36 PRJEB53466]
MKTSTSKEKLCAEDSRLMYNKLINSQKTNFDIGAIGMMHLVDEIDRLRKLWKEAEESRQQAVLETRKMEEALAKARKELTMSDIDVKDHKKHLRAMMEENKALKLDLNVYETREKQLKEAVKNGVFDSLTKEDRDQFAFLREPLRRNHSQRVHQRYPHLMEETQEEEDDSEVDYDETGDSFEDVIPLRNGREVRRSGNHAAKRRSASAHAPAVAVNSKRSRSRVMAPTIDEEPFQHEGGTPPKRCRDDGGHPEMTTTTTTTTTTIQNARQAATSLPRKMSRRSLSCGSIPSCDQTPGMQTTTNNVGMVSAILTKSTLDVRSMNKRTPAWTDGTVQEIAHRPHTFVEAGIKAMRKCDKCGTSLILTNSWKCKDCHQVVHKSCCNKLHLPCIPRPKNLMTPKSTSRNQKLEYRLQDFCTLAKPMIPSAVIHCVVALEAHGLGQEGLYRVPGPIRTVTALLDELRSKTVPNVSLQDVEVVTETLKRFLRELRDPLVPRTSRQEFIAAATMFATDPDDGRLALNKAICELPHANRDTMSYLFVHWRKVISHSDRNKMTAENMARVLAPCVMGLPKVTQPSVNRDVRDCERTLMALFSFDDIYWQRFLGTSAAALAATAHPIESIRQERVALCDRSILGPVSKSPGTPLIARPAQMTRQRGANILGSMRDE